MMLTSVACKLAMNIDMTGNPLLVLGAILCVVSVQLFSLGLLGKRTRVCITHAIVDGRSRFARRFAVKQLAKCKPFRYVALDERIKRFFCYMRLRG